MTVAYGGIVTVKLHEFMSSVFSIVYLVWAWQFLRNYGHFNVLQQRTMFHKHMTVIYGRNKFNYTGPSHGKY